MKHSGLVRCIASFIAEGVGALASNSCRMRQTVITAEKSVLAAAILDFSI